MLATPETLGSARGAAKHGVEFHQRQQLRFDSQAAREPRPTKSGELYRHLMRQTPTVLVPARLDGQSRLRGRFAPHTDPCHRSDIFLVRLEA
jgi:hypothetical protein